MGRLEADVSHQINRPSSRCSISTVVRTLSKNRRLKKLKNDCIYYTIVFVIKLLRAMGRRSSIALMNRVGILAFTLARNERNKTIRHLTWAFGEEKTPSEIKALAKKVFLNLSTCIADAVRLPILTRQGFDTLVSVEGLEHLERAVARGRGVILQTGHFGNWELLGTWFAKEQFPIKVIAKKAYDPRLDRLIVEYRNQAGYANTARGSAMTILINGLKKGYIFGLLFDIDTKVKGTFVNFFGRPAHTATAPVMLAKQLGAPIVPIFIRLKNDLTYHITVEEPLKLIETGNVEKDILANTQQCSDIYETWIRNYPEQWIWMHERWKKQPAGRIS